MAKPISELLNRLPAERQAAIKTKTAVILAQLDLPEIRKTMDMTQQGMADALGSLELPNWKKAVMSNYPP